MEQASMNHLDLFSGIGGFALAARWAGFETKLFCEKDKFCQKVLEKITYGDSGVRFYTLSRSQIRQN